MNDIFQTILGLCVPVIGTTLGSALVFLIKGEFNSRLERFLLGFASGIMIAASVWSLIIPAIELSEGMRPAWLPASLGFLLGIALLLLLDILIPAMQASFRKHHNQKCSSDTNTMLVLAVTLHNFPEGMAVGVLYAAALSGTNLVSFTSALLLSIGIAIQNIPEGAVISAPLYMSGTSKIKAFLIGTASGLAEPLGALLTIALIGIVKPTLPYILSLAAGAMIYVVVEELIPQAKADTEDSTAVIGVALGFVLMMTLDVALG